MNLDVPWWRDAVFYQIYPRSFCDTDGDGIGDLEGIRRHLDHIVRLGADALWISPFFRSPMADFGYDVSDFCDVDPLFGDLDDFDRLIEAAHTQGLRVVIDWVPNHTSSAHRWFSEARSSRDSPRRDWYIWRDDRSDAQGGSGPPGSPGRLPNNWLAAFPGVGGDTFPPAWTWDPGTDQWYLHFFLPEQPDLRWGNPEVRSAMADTLRFWMDRGVDGFRVDVAHGLGKDPALADLPPELAPLPVASINDRSETHPYLAELRGVLDAHQPPAMMVGEVFLPTTPQVARYYGSADRPELQLSFNFPPLFAPWDAAVWRQRVEETETSLGPERWPTWVLSNHDQVRHRTRYGGSEERARAAAVLLLTLRGTPFLFAGEELGLEDAVVAPQQRGDPGGRDGCRAPLPWDASADHGWAKGSPAWLPWPPEASGARNVAAQEADSDGILHLYRRLLAARRASPALRRGTWSPLDAHDGLLACLRHHGDDRRGVVVNFSTSPQPIPATVAGWNVEVASDARPAGPGLIAADQALLLHPAH